MYTVSDAFKNRIASNVREFDIRITFITSTDELTGTTIQDVTLEESLTSSNSLGMGCACSNKITINLIEPPTIDYDGARFEVRVGLKLEDGTIEYVPLGKYYATEAETSNDFKTLKLVAYDGFSQMAGQYVPSRTINTLQDLYDDLKAQLASECSITLKSYKPIHLSNLASYPFVNFAYVENATYRDNVAYLAGCLGGNARFDRNGELEIVWYSDTDITVGQELQYMGGLKRTTDKALTITSLSTGTTDNPIVFGDGVNGTAIKYENPYITTAMANDIFNKVNGYSYIPCEVKWRGNPALQAGDIVQVVDKNEVSYVTYVMEQTLKVSGGCSQTIYSKGSSKTESAFSSKYETVSQKLNKVYATMEQAILNATNAITGNKGGYVVLHDASGNGKPDEILVMDAEEIDKAIKVWRWNKEGLGYSSTGYNGSFDTAITADGQINASFITTGQLNASLVRIGDGVLSDYVNIAEGVIEIGGKDNRIVLRMENEEIAFYDTTNANNPTPNWIATPNSIEIVNLKGGKIRFQNFAWYPRESGNLSFTLYKE